MRVPLNCTIGPEAVAAAGLEPMMRSAAFRAAVLPALEELPPHLRVSLPQLGTILTLMVEGVRGGRSRWAGYLATLPPADETGAALLWPPAQLRWLEGTGLPEMRRGVLRAVRRCWAAAAPWLAPRAGEWAAGGGAVGEAALLRAWALFAARHFVLDARAEDARGAGRGAARREARMVPGLDLVNHCAVPPPPPYCCPYPCPYCTPPPPCCCPYPCP